MMPFSRTLWGIAAALLLQVVVAQAQQVSSGATAPPAPVIAQPAPPAVPLAQSPQAVPMQATPPDVAQQAARSPGVGPLHDLSPWSMFLSADWLVKAVIVGLVFASLATWTILIAKTAQLFRARRQLGDNLGRIADSRSLGEAQM
ncbi:MAG: tonB-system energizer ExbB, partial [Xanthobacteraceae bacterium]